MAKRLNWEIIGDILRITALGGLGVAGILAILIWKKNLATRITYIRLVIQAISFAALFYVFSYTIPLLYVLIILFGITLVFGRLYCGWFCPLGFVMDLEVLVRKSMKIRYKLIPDKLNKALHKSRYAILLFFLFLPIPMWLLQPPPDFNFATVMAQLLAGPFRPYSILLDPMIPFVVPWTNAALTILHINLTFPYVQEFTFYLGQSIGQIIAIILVGLTLAASFVFRRFWCRFCPTGASLGVMNRFKGFKWAPLLHLEKDEAKCTKCGVCKRVCQSQVTEVYDQKGGKINTSMCLLCLRCAEMCPYKDTLKLRFGNKTLFKSRNWLEPTTNE